MTDWNLDKNVEGLPVVKKYRTAGEIADLVEAQTGRKVKVTVCNENGVVWCKVDDSVLSAGDQAKVKSVLSGG